MKSHLNLVVTKNQGQLQMNKIDKIRGSDLKFIMQTKQRKANRALHVFIVLALMALTLALFSPALHFEAVDFDDDFLVFENVHFEEGLTPKSIRWVLTQNLFYPERHADYWRPISFLSHLIDLELFGRNPTGHHAVNLVFHSTNVALLFSLLFFLTRSPWKSGTVALLFAIHPLQVEPVAWISARKDLLAFFWGLILMHVYVRFPKQLNTKHFLVLTVLFLLCLMSKPVLITVPFLLVLLDIWPLGRVDTSKWWRGLGQSISGKWFLFFYAFAFIIVPFIPIRGSWQAENYGHWLITPISAYWFYLIKIFLPLDLGLYKENSLYALSTLQSILVFSGLIGVTALSIRQLRKRPHLFVGWFWFLSALAPSVLWSAEPGDRYMYVSLVGLAIYVVWGISDVLSNKGVERILRLCLPFAVAFVLARTTMNQLPYWKNTIALWERAVEVNDRNDSALNKLGIIAVRQGFYEKGLAYSKRALELNPLNADAMVNIGVVYDKQGKREEAVDIQFRALWIDPNHPLAHFNLGVLFRTSKEYEKARHHFEEVIRLDPRDVEAIYKLALTYLALGEQDKAKQYFIRTLRLDPKHEGAGKYVVRRDSFDSYFASASSASTSS
jgi:protein O-mannosyl-transferase